MVTLQCLAETKVHIEKTIFPLNNQGCKPSSSGMAFQPCLFIFSLKSTAWSLPFLQCSYHAVCYLASSDLSPSFHNALPGWIVKNCHQDTSTCVMPLQLLVVSSRADYITRTATRGMWRCSSGPYMPGGRSTQVWSLPPPWRENKMWFSGSFDINIWLTYIVWILHCESKGSVWPFYMIWLPSNLFSFLYKIEFNSSERP